MEGRTKPNLGSLLKLEERVVLVVFDLFKDWFRLKMFSSHYGSVPNFPIDFDNVTIGNAAPRYIEYLEPS
jgi:hypothetical protein